ncbi:MAG: hypothetical protein ABIH65_03260 [Nanoarchaeota archaeon]
MADKTKTVMIVLVVIILALASFITYSFLIKPTIQGYVVKQQSEGITQCLTAILTQIQQYGAVQIPLGEDQVLTLIQPEMCSQIQQQQQPEAPVE